MSLDTTRAARPTRVRRTPSFPSAAIFGALCVALGIAVGCYSPKPAPPVEWPAYRLGAPDLIEVNILPDPSISEELTVRPDGKVTVQLIGDVQAGGRTTDEVASEIQERVARYKRGAVVTVSLRQAQSSLITILGEVGRPQTLAITRQMRVSDVIGQASDLTNLANTDEIRVIRPGGPGVATQVIMVNMDAIRDGDLSTNIQLYDGDIVYVEPTVIAKIGYVIRQLLFPFDPLFNAGRNALRL